MDVEIPLLVGSICMLVLALILAINQHTGTWKDSPLTLFIRRSKPKKEKRLFPRCETSLEAKYQALSEEGISWIRDISSGGARLFVSKSLEAGTPLRMQVQLPYDSNRVVIKGTVVWSRKNDAGLSFDETSQEGIGRIIQYTRHRFTHQT